MKTTYQFNSLCFKALFVLALFSVGTNAFTEDEATFVFKNWMKQEQQEFSLSELSSKFSTFWKNLEYLAATEVHYRDSSHELGMGPLAATSPEDYNKMLGFKPQKKLTSNENKSKMTFSEALFNQANATQKCPTDESGNGCDWRLATNPQVLNPVKNQGQCGSCYTFSATCAVEAQHALATGELVSLSEEMAVDCSQSYGNNGCNGGLMDDVFEYLISQSSSGGQDAEADYSYTAGTSEQAGKCEASEYKGKATISSYQDVPEGDEEALMNAVASKGPVSIAIDASHTSFQLYSGGVYKEEQCSAQSLDHGVTLVGYGTDATDGDYWIVRNSWGPTWGEEGYIRMARGQSKFDCGITASASYPVV